VRAERAELGLRGVLTERLLTHLTLRALTRASPAAWRHEAKIAKIQSCLDSVVPWLEGLQAAGAQATFAAAFPWRNSSATRQLRI
jgi:hypothetical protein